MAVPTNRGMCFSPVLKYPHCPSCGDCIIDFFDGVVGGILLESSSSMDISVLLFIVLASHLFENKYVLSTVVGVSRSRNSSNICVNLDISLSLLYYDDSGLASKYRIRKNFLRSK